MSGARVERLSVRRRRPDSRAHSPARIVAPAGAAPNRLAAEVYLSRKNVDLYSFDADYLRRLKEREPVTEAHFVSYFTPRLHMKLRQRGFSSPTLDDIRQDTFLRVIRAVQQDDIQHPERFGAYVASVCDKVILEKWREMARHQHLDVEEMEVPDSRVNLESLVLHKEKRRMVAEIIEELPAKKRDILRALVYEHLDRDELCRRFEVNGDYLRVLLFRAKEDFAVRLKAKGWDEPGNHNH